MGKEQLYKNRPCDELRLGPRWCANKEHGLCKRNAVQNVGWVPILICPSTLPLKDSETCAVRLSDRGPTCHSFSVCTRLDESRSMHVVPPLPLLSRSSEEAVLGVLARVCHFRTLLAKAEAINRRQVRNSCMCLYACELRLTPDQGGRSLQPHHGNSSFSFHDSQCDPMHPKTGRPVTAPRYLMTDVLLIFHGK